MLFLSTVWVIQLSPVNVDAAGTEGDADAVPKVTKQLEKQVIEEKEEDVEEGESLTPSPKQGRR